ncbi:unnamed protein product [Schistosoma rodhaini]|uniref:GLE1 RNA export mediator n=1 Tax=Schistosoma rodhaini TaxID=6188 RepID=A0AA85FZ88_9TREM|nr:unnamed protein product [Schistosoma rodhaini]CAH8597547.1 unnamed protein product [Schistosoma rodhaini]
MSADFETGYLCGIRDAWVSAVAKHSNAVRVYEQKFVRSQRSIARVADLLEKSFNSLSLNVNSEENEEASINTCQTETTYAPAEIYPSTACMGYYGFSRRQTNQDLLNDIINNIISVRVEVMNLRRQNLGSSLYPSDSLINEIEEIETRALTLMTSPSPIFDDCDGAMDYQMELIMKKLELQAKECLLACKTVTSTGLPKTKQLQSTISVTSDVSLSENDSVFPTFGKARALLENYTNILYPSLWDSKFKMDALKIKKDITCACSQISSHDPPHCIGRLECLLNIFRRTTITDCSEQTKLGKSRNTNQLVDSFAWQCLYSSSISQAEKQFAYNIDITLVYGSLLSGIFALFPDKLFEFFGRIFLACPALGLFSDPSGLNLIEEMFSTTDILSNWRGVARLFTALLLAHPPPHLGVSRHKLLNPSLLWRVIAGIVNQEFIPCATAEVLHGILEIGGSVFVNLYGNQAKRLLNTISMIVNKSPILRQSLPEMQLMSLLEKYESIDTIPDRIGFIDKSFWDSV